MVSMLDITQKAECLTDALFVDISARNLTTKVTIHRQTRSLLNNILDKKCGASTVHTMIYDDFTNT